jgi:hypothetical protein
LDTPHNQCPTIIHQDNGQYKGKIMSAGRKPKIYKARGNSRKAIMDAAEKAWRKIPPAYNKNAVFRVQDLKGRLHLFSYFGGALHGGRAEWRRQLEERDNEFGLADI